MKKPFIIWSGLNGAGDDINYEEVDSCIKVWKSREKLLAENGVGLKLLVPSKDIRTKSRNNHLPVIEHFQEHRPDLLVECPGVRRRGYEDHYDQRVNWPRDNFNFLGNRVFISDCDFVNMTLLMKQLNVPLRVFPSRIGEGGISVGYDHTLIVSERKENGLVESDKSLLQRMGYSIHMMPVMENPAGKHGDGEVLYRRMNDNGHIDTEIGVVEKDSSRRTILVNREYLCVFQHQVEELVDKIKSELYVIEDPVEIMAKALNFITLPNGNILLDRQNEGLARFLKDELGKERVIPIETFRRECTLDDGGGGLRCRTNLIY